MGVAVRHVTCGFYLFFPPGYVALWDSKISHRPAGESVSWCLETSLFFKTPFSGWISIPTSFASLFIFYILSYLLSKTMGCFSGCLMSSASIQKFFCGICLVLKCSFNEFVGEKVVSSSYSSTILGLLPVLIFNMLSCCFCKDIWICETTYLSVWLWKIGHHIQITCKFWDLFVFWSPLKICWLFIVYMVLGCQAGGWTGRELCWMLQYERPVQIFIKIGCFELSFYGVLRFLIWADTYSPCHPAAPCRPRLLRW